MLHPAIIVKEQSAIHGTGLVAARPIYKGEVVWREDPGQQRFTREEARRWAEEQGVKLELHVYQSGENEYTVSPAPERYMNHSCDPTAWWGPGNALVARRDIQPGQEITYDYTSNDILGEYRMRCNCGSTQCRGVITNRDYLRLDRQLRYWGHLPPHVRRALRRVNLQRSAAAAVVLMLFLLVARSVMKHEMVS